MVEPDCAWQVRNQSHIVEVIVDSYSRFCDLGWPSGALDNLKLCTITSCVVTAIHRVCIFLGRALSHHHILKGVCVQRG